MLLHCTIEFELISITVLALNITLDQRYYSPVADYNLGCVEGSAESFPPNFPISKFHNTQDIQTDTLDMRFVSWAHQSGLNIMGTSEKASWQRGRYMCEEITGVG